MKSAVLAFDSTRDSSFRLASISRPAAVERIPAFDYLRVFVIFLVVLHHAVMAYCAGGAQGFAAFWAHMVTKGPWPSGPLWFLGALLLFDLATVMVLARTNVQRLTAAWDRLTPGRQVLVFLALAAVAYLPALAALAPRRWGPSPRTCWRSCWALA